MPRLLAIYYLTYVVFLSHIQQLKNKRHVLLFIGKSEKPYRLTKYEYGP
jgi:hypothetical protein